MSGNPGSAGSTAAHFIEKVNIIANPTLSGLDKAVIKSTKRTLKPLKMKHISLIVSSSWNQGAVLDVFRLLESRLTEQHWVISFKTLIVCHILMKEGNAERVYGFLTQQAMLLNMAGFRDKSGSTLGHEQGKNLKAYAMYLEEKVAVYRDLRRDPVRDRDAETARLRSLPATADGGKGKDKDGGLLGEIARLQEQLQLLLGCRFYDEEIDNIVTMQAFRLLLGDLLVLFALVNEGIIHMLQQFFELPRRGATRALQLYKTFATQTSRVVDFLELAKKLQRALEIDVPELSHAPVSLLQVLEEYVAQAPAEADAASSPAGARLASPTPASSAANRKTGPTAPPSTQFAPQPLIEEPSSDALVLFSGAPAAAARPRAGTVPAIDFFGSLDDEVTSTAVVQRPPNPPAAAFAYNPFGNGDALGLSVAAAPQGGASPAPSVQSHPRAPSGLSTAGPGPERIAHSNNPFIRTASPPLAPAEPGNFANFAAAFPADGQSWAGGNPFAAPHPQGQNVAQQGQSVAQQPFGAAHPYHQAAPAPFATPSYTAMPVRSVPAQPQSYVASSDQPFAASGYGFPAAGAIPPPFGAPQAFNAQQSYGSSQQPFGSSQQPFGSSQQPYGSSQQPFAASQQPVAAPQQFGAPASAAQGQQRPGNSQLLF